MRDPVLNEALRRLAAEAATRFSSLVATGEEIPFDVAEDDGENALFYRYVPLTSRFVEDRQDELRSLPGFEPARAAVIHAEVAAPYLEARGETVPADPEVRAERMLISFFTRLWDGCGEFSLDRGRLEKALHVLDAEARDVHEADVLIAPIAGLEMPLARLALPSGVRVVRADTVDAPTEAMRSEGMNRKAWEPQFLALAELGEGAGAASAAMHQLRDLISVMRLFKEGGIGIGPYAFAPTGEDRWRRIATGAPAARPGGYHLTEAEAAELAQFAEQLEAQPDPEGSLAWAVGRFEMGCERATALDGLSDHLLALRALLVGDGSVGAELPRRAAALIAEPGERDEARARIDRAFALERSLMGTATPIDAGEDTGTALGLATWVEDALRALLRDGALGKLGADVGAAADDSLISSGLVTGEVSEALLGDGAEWDAIEIEAADEPDFDFDVSRGDEIRANRHPSPPRRPEPLQRPARSGREAEHSSGI